MDKTGVLQIVIILFIIGVMYYLLRIYRAMKYVKRLGRFALAPVHNHDIPFLDSLKIKIWSILSKISKIIGKSTLLTNYGKKYTKYISYEERKKKDGLDYVSMKFLMSIVVLLLSIITSLFQPVDINFMFFITLFIASFFIPDIILYFSFSLKRRVVEDDLLKAIIVMNNAFRSGRDIMQAIDHVKTELDGPISDEFQKIYLDMTYGLSVDIVFNRFYERIKLEDAKQIATTLSVLNKTGGNIVEVFSLIEKSIMNKKNLKNELNSLTASSKLMYRFLVFLPLFFVGLVMILNPRYFLPLFNNILGIMILIIIILLYILYILAIKKVLGVAL